MILTHQQAQPNTQTHPPTSPTQHTNTPTDPPKIKTLITHKHTTHNPQTHNTNIVVIVQQDPKYIYIYIYCYECKHVTHSLDNQIIIKKKKVQPIRPIKFSQTH